MDTSQPANPKPTNSISWVVLAIVLFTVAGGVWYGIWQGSTKEKNLNNGMSQENEETAIFRETESQDPEYLRYESERFDFFISVPKTYRFRVDPPTGNQLAVVTLMTPNNDQATIHDKNGPKGVNTKSEHMVWIEVYLNQPHRNLPNEENFRLWHQAMITGRTVKDIEYQNNGGNGKLFIGATEADGAVSVGRYKYFFGEDYVIVLGSDDLTKEELFDLTRFLGIPGADIFLFENY